MTKVPFTVVTFETERFNRTEPKDYFINDCCYGDDLCRWLSGELSRYGALVESEIGQEDCGWYVSFAVHGVAHCFMVTTDGEGWIGFLERDRGVLLSLLGQRRRGITPAAAEVIHEILDSDPEIGEIEWHDFNGFTYKKPYEVRSRPF